MPELLLVWKAIVASACVSALIVLAPAKSFANRLPPTMARSVTILAIGLGLSVGCWVSSLNLVFPPRGGLDRLLLIIIPAALAIELFATVADKARPVANGMRVILAIGLPRILLHDSEYLNDWTSFQMAWVTFGSVVMLVGATTSLTRLSQRDSGLSVVLALGLAIQAAAATIMMGGYIQGGVAAFLLATILMTTGIAGQIATKGWIGPASFDPRVVVVIGVLGLFGMLTIGRFFGSVSTGDAAILMLAPLLCWTTEIRPLRHSPELIVGSIRLILVSIPLLLVLMTAKKDFDREMVPLLTIRALAVDKIGRGQTDLHELATAASSTGFRLRCW